MVFWSIEFFYYYESLIQLGVRLRVDVDGRRYWHKSKSGRRIVNSANYELKRNPKLKQLSVQSEEYEEILSNESDSFSSFVQIKWN